MNIKKLLLIFNLFFVAAAQAFPQAAFSGEDHRSDFVRAMDLFNKEKYAPAIRLFDSYIRDNTDNNSTRMPNTGCWYTWHVIPRVPV